jgi:hypothetical protein
VHYDPQGGSPAPQSQTGEQYVNSYNTRKIASPQIRLADAIEKPDATFVCWFDSSTGTAYEAGETITVRQDTVLKAQWSGGSGGEDDYGNDFGTAQNWTLKPGKVNSLPGRIEAEKDADVFRFVAPVTGMYRIYASGQPASLVYLDGYLYNAQHELLHTALQIHTPFEIVRELRQGETYFLKLDGYSGYGSYQINIAVPADPGTPFDTAVPWALPPKNAGLTYISTVSAVMESPTDSYFKMTTPYYALNSGSSGYGEHSFTIDAADPSLSGWIVYLYNEDQELLYTKDLSTSTYRSFFFELEPESTYYLRVHAESGAGYYQMRSVPLFWIA